MHRYTLGLALFDYLPVIMAGIGIWLICRYCAALGNRSGAWIIIIPLIATSGGFLKATWKMIVVITGNNIQWLSDQLFFFIAAGYVMLAAAVVLSLRADAAGRSLAAGWWKLPAAIAAVIIVSALILRVTYDQRYWSTLLLVTMSIANLIFALRLIAHSFDKRNWLSLFGFSANLVISYALVGLARIEEQTLELQWVEEILNLAAMSLLTFAAWNLIKARRAAQNVL